LCPCIHVYLIYSSIMIFVVQYMFKYYGCDDDDVCGIETQDD
jgi:hypothetical protein